MLSIVGERESVHAKLEARTALRYVQCGIHIYIYRERERERERENHSFTSLGRLAMLANNVGHK